MRSLVTSPSQQEELLWRSHVASGTQETEAALAKHLLRHARRITHTILQRIDDDIAQRATIHVLRNLDTFEGRSAFSTWFHSIVANMCYYALRQQYRTKLQELKDFHAIAELNDSSVELTCLRKKLSQRENAILDWKLSGAPESDPPYQRQYWARLRTKLRETYANIL
jgi:RNA polymerase sigma factor (sigma-70 family)